MDQLYTTVAVLGSRLDVQVPDSLRTLVTHRGGRRDEALTAQLPPLYALANALDADEPDLFYPGFYTDGPDAGAWVDPPVAWGEARVLRPEDDVVTTEVYGVVDSALAELDPIDAGLVTLVDIEGTPFRRAVLDLGLPAGEARGRLARARLVLRAALDGYLRR